MIGLAETMRAESGRAVAVSEIGLSETIDALRAELAAAVERARNTDIQFPVAGVQLEWSPWNWGTTRRRDGTVIRP